MKIGVEKINKSKVKILNKVINEEQEIKKEESDIYIVSDNSGNNSF